MIQKFLFFIALSLLSYESFADVAVYDLNGCKDSVYIGDYAQKKLYLCGVSDSIEFNRAVVIHADKTPQDFTFSVEETEVGAAKSLQIIHGDKLKQVNPPFLQALYEGLCAPAIYLLKDVQLIEGGFILNYHAMSDCSRYVILDETADTWQWDGELFQKTASHTRYPTDEAFATYKQLLSEGKLIQAIEHAPESDPTGGWSNCHYDVYQAFFVATYKKIKTLHNEGDPFSAIAMSVWLLENSPVFPVARCIFDEDTPSFVLSYSNDRIKLGDGTESSGFYPDMMLKQQSENSLMLHDLARWIHLLYPKKATMLLEQIIAYDPENTAAHLTLADTMFISNNYYQQDYQNYVDLMKKHKRESEIPSYVFERLKPK